VLRRRSGNRLRLVLAENLYDFVKRKYRKSDTRNHEEES
jgi:hypothetical protein